MNRTSKLLTTSAGLFAAAMTGLMSGCQHSSSSDAAGTSVQSMDMDKHACKGQNACKGHGGCKGTANACKGQNSCKGQGGCNTINPPAPQ
ncbi:MAG: hypothetical protein M3O30_11190 [Planctomycetota bacterium]|nr:hypothetical protein [Planctomycetota bacterium]